MALIAGTGGGKTWFGPIWLYRELARYPGPDEKFLVVSPTFDMLGREALPSFLNTIADTKLEGQLKMGSFMYVTSTGSRVFFRSADRWERLEGGQYRAAWMDEAGQMRSMAWTSVQARLGFHMGRCLFTTTPYRRNWLYKEVFKMWEAGDRDYFVSQFASTTNPYYPRHEYDRARRTMDPRLFRMRYQGFFEVLTGLVYPFFDRVWIKPFPIPKEWPRWGGIDWGFANPFASICGALDPNDRLWIFHAEKNPGTVLRHRREALAPLQATWLADPSGAQQIHECLHPDQGPRLNIFNPNLDSSDLNDIRMGLGDVAERILDSRIFVFDTLAQLRDEAESYCYAETVDGGEGDEKPVKVNDHLMDALRYLCRGLKLRRAKRLVMLG